MRAPILARVSTEEQKAAGNSLPAQVVRLKSYIDRTPSLSHDEEFVFDESAHKEHRKEFQKVLDYIEQFKFKEKIALCGDKVDRLTRDFLVGLPELERLRRDGHIELHFPSDNLVLHKDSPASDLFRFHIAVALAEYYSNAISDNTKRAFEHKRRKGEFVGKVPPIGYMRVPLENGKTDVVPDPERLHLVQKMFELYATNTYSFRSLKQRMMEMGLTSRNGIPLSTSNVQKALSDTFYIGIAISEKYGPYPQHHALFITKKLFDECRDVMLGRGKNFSKETTSTRQYIFKGVPCADCGCTFSPELKKGKYVTYSCTNAKGICKREYVSEKKLLKPIQGIFESFAAIPADVQERLVTELRVLNESEAIFHNREITRLQTEYNRLQKRAEALIDLFLDQSITKPDYDKKLQEIKDKQYLISVELDEHTKADHEYHIHVATVLNVCRRMPAIFEVAEPHEKRVLLNLLLQNLAISGRKLDFTMRKPFDVVLELASCTTELRR
jgi:site-specific DNA recombinase